MSPWIHPCLIVVVSVDGCRLSGHADWTADIVMGKSTAFAFFLVTALIYVALE